MSNVLTVEHIRETALTEDYIRYIMMFILWMHYTGGGYGYGCLTPLSIIFQLQRCERINTILAVF